MLWEQGWLGSLLTVIPEHCNEINLCSGKELGCHDFSGNREEQETLVAKVLVSELDQGFGDSVWEDRLLNKM